MDNATLVIEKRPARSILVRFATFVKLKRNMIIEIISSLLILLFVYTAASKVWDYENFRLQLGKSPFITEYADLVSWAIPAGEVLTALALTFVKTRFLGLYASLFLMTMFSAYIYAMLNYSYYLPCSCGGVLENMDWNTHFGFNICFVILSIVGIILYPPKRIKSSSQTS